MSAPLLYRWTGSVMEPLPRFHNAAAAQFTEGELYRLDVLKDRSQASHSHYFAAIHDGWLNLPEHLTERFPTSEHLRKWALIKAGFHDSRSIVANSKAEAHRLAVFVKPSDEFAVVTVIEATVTIYSAKSQSKRAMGAAEFKRSKEAVLGIIEEMVGVDRGEIERNAGKAA